MMYSNIGLTCRETLPLKGLLHLISGSFLGVHGAVMTGIKASTGSIGYIISDIILQHNVIPYKINTDEMGKNLQNF